jgi:hypothetical protein
MQEEQSTNVLCATLPGDQSPTTAMGIFDDECESGSDEMSINLDISDDDIPMFFELNSFDAHEESI